MIIWVSSTGAIFTKFTLLPKYLILLVTKSIESKLTALQQLSQPSLANQCDKVISKDCMEHPGWHYLSVDLDLERDRDRLPLLLSRDRCRFLSLEMGEPFLSRSLSRSRSAERERLRSSLMGEESRSLFSMVSPAIWIKRTVLLYFNS